MDIFGRRKIKYLENRLHLKDEVIKNLLDKNIKLSDDLKKYEEAESKKKNFIFLMNENIPEEQNARKNYFSDITMFYNKIFKSKISELVSAQKNALAIIGRKEEEYSFFRACINVFSLLEDWFVRSEREHLSDLEEARQAVENSEGMVDEITRKYK